MDNYKAQAQKSGVVVNDTYTYDANGNIASITDKDGKVITYIYDGLNQLTRENNQVTNKTILYTYDAGGNIKSRTEYSYNTAPAPYQMGTPISTQTFSYTDSTWKDLLTAYNGTALTYDAIGNPLTYRDEGTFTM